MHHITPILRGLEVIGWNVTAVLAESGENEGILEVRLNMPSIQLWALQTNFPGWGHDREGLESHFREKLQIPDFRGSVRAPLP